MAAAVPRRPGPRLRRQIGQPNARSLAYAAARTTYGPRCGPAGQMGGTDERSGRLDNEEDLVTPLLLERGEHALLGGG